MSDSLTPTEGARFLLEREREHDNGTRAIYRTRIYTPSATYEGSATLGDDGSASVTEQLALGAERPSPTSAAVSSALTSIPPSDANANLSDRRTSTKAPDDLVSTLQMLAKLTARSAAKKREDGLPPWPARILRWRGPGRGE